MGEGFLIRRKQLLELHKGSSSDRCSGRTTGLALEAIGQALQNPESEIQVRDHYGTEISHKNLLDMCACIVKKMGLEGFSYNKPLLSIKYSLEEPKKK